MRPMRQRILSGLASCLAFLGTSSFEAAATPVLDQAMESPDLGGGGGLGVGDGSLRRAQVFQAGLTGQLTSVDLSVDVGSASGDFIVEIFGANASNKPDTAMLFGAVTIAAASLPATPGFASYDLTSQDIQLIAGEFYGLGFRVTSGFATARRNFGNLYAAGRLWTGETLQDDGGINASSDVGFRTFVEVIPEPTTGLLVLSGLLGLGVGRRHRAA